MKIRSKPTAAAAAAEGSHIHVSILTASIIIRGKKNQLQAYP
jgi:hypothetical protein